MVLVGIGSLTLFIASGYVFGLFSGAVGIGLMLLLAVTYCVFMQRNRNQAVKSD